MLRKIYILLLISGVFAGFGARSQDAFSIEFGPILDEQKGNDLISVFGRDSTHFFTLRLSGRKNGGFIVEKIDTDSMHVQKTAEFFLPTVGGIDLVLKYPVELKERIYFLATAENPTTGEVNIYALEFNQNLNLDQTAILLGIGTRISLINGESFRLHKDREAETLMVLIPRHFEPERNAKFDVAIFDSSLKLLREKRIEIPHPSGMLSVDDILVKGQSHFYLLFSMEDPTLVNLQSERKMGRNHSVIEFSWETGKMREKSLAIGTKWLYDVSLVLNADSNVQIAGYYSNMVDLSIAGTFSVELDTRSGQIVNQGLSPLDRRFKAQFKRATNSDPSELGLFSQTRVFPAGKGLVQMVSEKEYAQNTTVFNPVTGTYSLIRIQNYDQLLVTGMAPSSQIVFNFTIPKFQSSTRYDALYTSFLSHLGSESLYLIYNDHERNQELTLTDISNHRQITSPSNTMAMLVRIGNNGSATKFPLFSTSDRNMTLTPYFYRTLPDGVVLTATNGYKTQFIRLKLQ